MEKIYIIEDDENIRNLLKIALEGFSFEAGFETEEGLQGVSSGMPSWRSSTGCSGMDEGDWPSTSRSNQTEG